MGISSYIHSYLLESYYSIYYAKQKQLVAVIKVLPVKAESMLATLNMTSTIGRLFSRTTIFTDFENFLFYMKIVSPK